MSTLPSEHASGGNKPVVRRSPKTSRDRSGLSAVERQAADDYRAMTGMDRPIEELAEEARERRSKPAPQLRYVGPR